MELEKNCMVFWEAWVKNSPAIVATVKNNKKPARVFFFIWAGNNFMNKVYHNFSIFQVFSTPLDLGKSSFI